VTASCRKAGRGDARARLHTGLVCALTILLAACSGSGPPPVGNDFLLPLAPRVPWIPLESDLAASDLAAAALASDRQGLSTALTDVRHADDVHKGEDLEALCTDLAHATLDDPKAYREASKDLKAGFGTDPALQARLDIAVEDDLLDLAWARRRDTWEVYWARTFNAASKPAGQAIFSGGMAAPLTLATSAANYLASFSNDEPLNTFDRQALALRKQYLRLHPDAEDAEKVQKQVDGAQKKLVETMHWRRTKSARRALRGGQNRFAIYEASRALHWGPNEEIDEIIAQADANLAVERALRSRSLTADTPHDARHAPAHALAVELLLTSSTGKALSEQSVRDLASRADGPGRDEARFVFAMMQQEAGYENAARETLAKLARQDGSAMARHAGHLVDDPWQDPYGAFRELRARKRREEVKWRLMGNYAFRSRYPNLPRPIAVALEAPGLAQTILTSPLRLIFGRWNKGPDFHKATAVLGYRYLARSPNGPNTHEVMGWLFDYEESQGNHGAALRLADFMPEVSLDKRHELSEETSEQALTHAAQIRRPDQRTRMLREATREFPETESGRKAGLQVRSELEEATPQMIRMTRGFLKENPRIAGRSALGLNPALLNGKIHDGELHPYGVAFVGGQTLRFDFVAESGDEDDSPERRYRDVSADRLAQLAAMLDEMSRRNQLIDPEDSLVPDGDRDAFLERARLGLLAKPDRRPTAQSTYVYRSMRERYGLVRGRESVLPFDLVFQGDFQDFRLGAYPRWRMPKETPDAFLYR
jgi:hypothetical protein